MTAAHPRSALLVTPLAIVILAGILSVALAVAPCAAADDAAAYEESGAWEEPDFLHNVRRLTYEGRRAGEGYFSPDGSLMVFQSERTEGNPFYQIYLMDMATGETQRISPGTGKTTCAFLHPESGDVLFASTHHDPRSAEYQAEELELREKGEERRYSWDYDPEMELWEWDAETGELERLTHARGYDAEASYSPDGEWIVFSSTRSGYGRELTQEEAKQRELNPSIFGEIYLMPAEGGEATRLTETIGYDGGPFFFPDGERIIWRRFDEEGLIADVWSMRTDGSDKRQLTDFGSMSWAPYVHPSGEYFFFASNQHGFGNFEIFVADVEGTKQPVRITTTDGFDGLPVPTPDGERLVWTSNRHGEKGGQLFIADWNHEKALEALERAPLRTPPLRADVEYLASDELGGRLTGTEGAEQAADYVARRLEAVGVRPLPGKDDHDGYRHPFEFTAGTEDAGTTLEAEGGDDDDGSWTGTGQVQALSFSDNATVSGELVFAGYGLVVPPSQDFPYDSYAGLDVEGKIALVLRYFPEDADQETRGILSRYSGLRYKALQARERGAVGLLVVAGPRSPNAGEVIPMTFDTAISGSGIAAASISGDVAAALFDLASGSEEGKSLEEAQKALDDANPHVTGFPLEGVEVELTTAVKRERRTGHNLLGYVPGTDPDAAEKPWIVLGAHYDHLGRGRGGNSLAKKDEAGDVHNGADDNASGVAALLEIASRVAADPPKRNVVFAFWSGEELGVLGSSRFVKEPPFPADGIAAYLNYDMVGRLRDNRLTVQAVGSAEEWPRVLEQTNVPVGFDLQLGEDPYLPTDSSSFHQADVPTLHFFTGSHDDYHRPTDDAHKIDYEGLERIARFGAILARRLGNAEEPPTFVDVEPATTGGGDRDTLRAFTGTIPDYTTEVEGLRLSGVVGGGPADEAGLREGDVIVEFAGQTITNIYDYTYALDAVKIGEPVEVVFLRDGERMEVTVTPRARD